MTLVVFAWLVVVFILGFIFGVVCHAMYVGYITKSEYRRKYGNGK